ncbi:hypothetical protein ACFRMQ_08010 [Kitasatospora sp. NPDC056783]|uniref:hypothetical protein n=1 Tax=Kitasatospora sp. NPDC056783 TaxID=3345943 RepID=UPI0036BE7525
MSFSDLSKNSKRVADTVERAQRVHVTRRDGEDPYLTTERHDRQREEAADATARLFAALITSDEGAPGPPRLPEVFPWARHLSAEEVREFVVDLVDATRDVSGTGRPHQPAPRDRRVTGHCQDPGGPHTERPAHRATSW